MRGEVEGVCSQHPPEVLTEPIEGLAVSKAHVVSCWRSASSTIACSFRLRGDVVASLASFAGPRKKA
jgi:hypothetical protein